MEAKHFPMMFGKFSEDETISYFTLNRCFKTQGLEKAGI